MQRGFGSNSVDDLQAKQTFLERRKMITQNAGLVVMFQEAVLNPLEETDTIKISKEKLLIPLLRLIM